MKIAKQDTRHKINSFVKLHNEQQIFFLCSVTFIVWQLINFEKKTNKHLNKTTHGHQYERKQVIIRKIRSVISQRIVRTNKFVVQIGKRSILGIQHFFLFFVYEYNLYNIKCILFFD